MRTTETLFNRHGVNGIEEVVAEFVQGRSASTPEEILMRKEEEAAMVATEMAAKKASQVEDLDVK